MKMFSTVSNDCLNMVPYKNYTGYYFGLFTDIIYVYIHVVVLCKTVMIHHTHAMAMLPTVFRCMV